MIADHTTGVEAFEGPLEGRRQHAGRLEPRVERVLHAHSGLIFLRHATNRYYAALAAIAEDKAPGKVPGPRSSRPSSRSVAP